MIKKGDLPLNQKIKLNRNQWTWKKKTQKKQKRT